MPIQVTCEQRRGPLTHISCAGVTIPLYTKEGAKQESNYHYSSAVHDKRFAPLDIP